MLITRKGADLIVVRQTDHMAQVARMAERWGNELFPAPENREETIRAAALHDNGWRIWEDHPTLVPETGRPRNLGEVERSAHAAFYSEGVRNAVAIDPYTGLLVSLHAAVLYAGVDGWNSETLAPPLPADASDLQRAFILEQATLQQRLRTELTESRRYGRSVAADQLWPAYLRLRAWDRLSLYFVFFGMGDGEIDRVPTTHGETRIALRQTGRYAASAQPWPFDQATVVLPVVASRVPDRAYKSGEEFLNVLVAARSEIEQFSLSAVD
ncbi:MAG: DUF3891 family protein [Chloroflexota bacterium]